MRKVAVIAGAGPAGLTSALELLQRSDVQPIVFEADAQVGGISPPRRLPPPSPAEKMVEISATVENTRS